MRGYVTTLLELTGCAAIIAGAALVFVPAAIVLAGVAMLAFAWRIS